MRDAVLCFLIEGGSSNQRILLGWKKRGFGQGRYVGIGGKIEVSESLKHAAVREIQEEVSISVQHDDLIYAGHLLFVFPYKPSWDHDVHVFVTKIWQGDAYESDEIQPVWFSLDDLPYASMWDDAHYWLPHILAGEVIEAHFTFQADNEIVATAQIKALPT